MTFVLDRIRILILEFSFSFTRMGCTQCLLYVLPIKYHTNDICTVVYARQMSSAVSTIEKFTYEKTSIIEYFEKQKINDR